MACNLMAHRRDSAIITESGATAVDRADLQTQYAAAATRLEAIRDINSPTNAQVVAALRDVAAIELRMLKYLRAL